MEDDREYQCPRPQRNWGETGLFTDISQTLPVSAQLYLSEKVMKMDIVFEN